MLENPKIEVQRSPGASTVEAGIARRRLIRAGLAAAPVMLGLKSQSALATGTTHISCSAWASLSAAKGCHSSHTQHHAGGTCNNYDYWTSHQSGECDKGFHRRTNHRHQTDYSKCVPFEGSEFQDKSLRDICKGNVSSGDSKKDKLAKHCASMYLNLKVSGNCPFDEDTIKTIWNSCKNTGGTWTPFTGGQPWDRDDCNEYFDYVCKGTAPLSWDNTCA